MNKIFKSIDYLKRRIQNNKKLFLLYSVLRGLVIFIAVRQILEGNFENAFLCIVALILFLLPSFMEEHFRIEIPPLFEGIIFLFIFAGEILGEVNNFYVRIPGWDTVLHTINGFLAAAIGFSMVDLLNRHNESGQLTPFYLAMVAFCFSMTVGVIWEFMEFGSDMFLGQDAQKDFIVQTIRSVTLDPTNSQNVITVSGITDTVIHAASGDVVIEGGYLDIGIIDTMKDLFVNLIGAVVFSALGYIYAKERNKKQTGPARIAAGLMVRVAQGQEEPI